MQGVSINLFVKTGKKKPNELGKVFHYDLFGKRELKYDFLNKNSLKSINLIELNPQFPELFFVPKDFGLKKSYDNGFALNSIFYDPAPGFVSCHDQFAISMSSDEMKNKIIKFIDSVSYEDASKNYKLCSTTQWNYTTAKKNILNYDWIKEITTVNYRPFDKRFTVFTNDVCTHRRIDRAMKHLYLKDNIGLIFVRQIKTSDNFEYVFLTDKIFESSYLSNKTGEITYVSPLYLYPDNSGQQTIDQSSDRTPNLNADIVKEIAGKIGLTFTDEKEVTKDTFAPIDILDYIYAVLHSPTYRKKYKEFLKIDFPRVPYPKDKDTFWKLVKLGGEIRQIHLLESAVIERPICKFNISGTDVVTKPKYENGSVYINETQCFEDVPEVAWNFYIGGYQPAQKWLKDRKDRELQIDDIRHYMKIIVALTETDRLMKEINKIEIE
jgi:predicted helicase